LFRSLVCHASAPNCNFSNIGSTIADLTSDLKI
jgi:hypothetical protein